MLQHESVVLTFSSWTAILQIYKFKLPSYSIAYVSLHDKTCPCIYSWDRILLYLEVIVLSFPAMVQAPLSCLNNCQIILLLEYLVLIQIIQLDYTSNDQHLLQQNLDIFLPMKSLCYSLNMSYFDY